MYIICKGEFITEKKSHSENSNIGIDLLHEELQNNEISANAKDVVNKSKKRKSLEDKSKSKKTNTGLSESNINKKKNDEVLDQNQQKISENEALIENLLRKVRDCDIYLSGLQRRSCNFDNVPLSSDVINLDDYQRFKIWFEEKENLESELSEIPKSKRKERKDRQEQILKKQEKCLKHLTLVANFMEKRIGDFFKTVNCQ